MNRGMGRHDLRRIHDALGGNFQCVRVTAGTLAWNALYAFVHFLWWRSY